MRRAVTEPSFLVTVSICVVLGNRSTTAFNVPIVQHHDPCARPECGVQPHQEFALPRPWNVGEPEPGKCGVEGRQLREIVDARTCNATGAINCVQ
jgi:hypothetical protein